MEFKTFTQLKGYFEVYFRSVLSFVHEPMFNAAFP